MLFSVVRRSDSRSGAELANEQLPNRRDFLGQSCAHILFGISAAGLASATLGTPNGESAAPDNLEPGLELQGDSSKPEHVGFEHGHKKNTELERNTSAVEIRVSDAQAADKALGSRRRSLDEFAADVGEGGLYCAPQIGFFQYSIGFRQAEAQAAVVDSEKIYPYTDCTSALPGGGELRNIGAVHVTPQYVKHQSFFQAAVAAADVVLLEGGSGAEPSATSFFDKIRADALLAGKKVYNIDPQLSSTHVWNRNVACSSFLVGVASILGGVRGVEAFGRTLARGVGALGALTGFPSVPYIAHRLIAGNKGYARLDVGWTTDGRTLRMLRHIDKIASEHPGAKILAVTGDYHARGFEHYRAHPRERSGKDLLYRMTLENLIPGGRAPEEIK